MAADSGDSAAGDSAAGSCEPAGQGDYVVRQGDCLNSIAYTHGFFWQTLWNLPENAGLRQHRDTPFQLMPGDRVTVPELRQREEASETEQLHRFRRKSVPAVLKLRILDVPQPTDATDESPPEEEEGQEGVELVVREPAEDALEPEPACDRPYDLIVDGVRGPSGRTDDDGLADLTIPPDARLVRVILDPGTPNSRTLTVRLGALDPLSSPAGQAQRLLNLGFTEDPSGSDPQALSQGLEAFQRNRDLEPTGRADSTTLDRLREAHGS